MTVKRTTQQIMPPARWIDATTLALRIKLSSLGALLGMEEYVAAGVTQQLSRQFQCDAPPITRCHRWGRPWWPGDTWWHLVTPGDTWWHLPSVCQCAYGSSQCIANVAHVQELRMHENEAWKGPLWAIDWSWFFLPKWSRKKKTAEMHWKSLTCAFWHVFKCYDWNILKPRT